jgi:drug/metabolite transporter (DMT)-like permease
MDRHVGRLNTHADDTRNELDHRVWTFLAAGIDLRAAILFASVGVFFPAMVTLLNFESNRLMGPNIAGAISGLAPVFAVLLAVVLIGETLRAPQLLGIAAIVLGMMLMYRGQRRASPPTSLWHP